MSEQDDDLVVKIADALDDATRCHEQGRFSEIAPIHARVESMTLAGSHSQARDVAMALNFLDGWVDASNHDWQYYEGIDFQDWPGIAREISNALRAQTEISLPLILEHFNIGGSPRDSGILGRLKKLLRV
ncbi:MAG: hypothetical protein AAGM16_10320 [Pseudomonadota bacterium]